MRDGLRYLLEEESDIEDVGEVANGREVLEQVKSNDKTKKIPIVIVTSSKEAPDIEAAYILGANSYVVKPVGFDQFKETINQLGLYWLVINEKYR